MAGFSSPLPSHNISFLMNLQAVQSLFKAGFQILMTLNACSLNRLISFWSLVIWMVLEVQKVVCASAALHLRHSAHDYNYEV